MYEARGNTTAYAAGQELLFAQLVARCSVPERALRILNRNESRSRPRGYVRQLDLSTRERRTQLRRPCPKTEDPRRDISHEWGTRLDAQAKRDAVGSHACPSCPKACLDQALIAPDDAHPPLPPALNGRQI